MLWKMYKVSAIGIETQDLAQVDAQDLGEITHWCDELLIALEWLFRSFLQVDVLFLLVLGRGAEGQKDKEFFEKIVKEAKEKQQKLK
jgi:hypothetical protein